MAEKKAELLVDRRVHQSVEPMAERRAGWWADSMAYCSVGQMVEHWVAPSVLQKVVRLVACSAECLVACWVDLMAGSRAGTMVAHWVDHSVHRRADCWVADWAVKLAPQMAARSVAWKEAKRVAMLAALRVAESAGLRAHL